MTSYRGPDETKFYNNLNEKIFIGFNRLSIMEPNNSSQPLMDENKKLLSVLMEKFTINLKLGKN